MSELSWHSELLRFREMSKNDQIEWLANLLSFITMLARDTYEAGTEGVANPKALRRSNELTHRVSCFLREFVGDKENSWPHKDLFELIEHESSKLGFSQALLEYLNKQK